MSRIVKVTSWALRAPVDEPFFMSQPGEVTARSSMVVAVQTDDGLVGWGESLCNAFQPPEIAAATVDALLAGMVTGRDALHTGVLFEEMYNRTKDFGMKGVPLGAISAIDIALWDLKGQLLGQPVHALLGGAFRSSIASYATGFFRTRQRRYPDALIEEALGHIEHGFDAMKIKIGLGVDRDLQEVAAVRDAVGSDIRLLVDANHAYNAGEARRLVRGLDELGVYWLEEPITPEDIDGYRSLVEMGPKLLIAAGENEFSRFGFWPWVARRAVDVLQPDLCAAGGFTSLQQIQALALAAGLTINPHVWGTAIGLTASLHFLASVPPNPISRAGQEPLLEFDQSSHPFRTQLVDAAPQLVDGRVPVPDRPGLGITVDRSLLDAHECRRR